MFKTVDRSSPERAVTMDVDGKSIAAQEGASLALVLLAADVRPFRYTAVSNTPRAPLCLMGVCFDCLVHVDGQPNVQACMTQVREGMRIQVPRGAPAIREVA